MQPEEGALRAWEIREGACALEGAPRWDSSLQFELHPPVFLITPAVTSLVTVTTMS